MKLNTKLIHSNFSPDVTEHSCALPIHRTSSYVFTDSKDAADLFALKKFGNIYSRLTNPTVSTLEKRLADIEGAVASVAFASGTAAIFNTIINIAKCGDNIIAANNTYGGTFTMFDAILPDLGIKTTFVNYNDYDKMELSINEKTRAIYIEAVGNPLLDIPDFTRISDIAKKANIPLIVDSTFMPPGSLNVIQYGANIVIHSLTKWVGGHGTAIGGVVLDAGTFDWSLEKFDLYRQPDRGYHNMRWGHDLGDLSNLAFSLRLRTVPLRNLGACMSPDNAWFFLQGLETLTLRFKKHCDNAMAVANFLKNSENVNSIKYPGLESSESYSNSLKYLKNGYGGVILFSIKNKDPEEFINKLKLFYNVANVGDSKSLVLHPASTSHSQLNDEQLKSSGLTKDSIRLSIGIEDIDDIISDLEQALK